MNHKSSFMPKNNEVVRAAALADMFASCHLCKSSADENDNHDNDHKKEGNDCGTINDWKDDLSRMSSLSLHDLLSNLRHVCGLCRYDSKQPHTRPTEIKDAIPSYNQGDKIKWVLWALTSLDLPPSLEKDDVLKPATPSLWQKDAGKIVIIHEPQG